MSISARYQWGDKAIETLSDGRWSTKACMAMVNAAIKGEPMTERQADMYIWVTGKIGSIPEATPNLYSWWREKYAETGDQQYLDKMLDNVEMQ